jgi:hypothetical protein
MNQQETIRLLYESEGKSLREISEITKHDFRTVRKYAYQEDWRPPADEALRPENFKVLGPYIPIIDGWLEDDKKVPRKPYPNESADSSGTPGSGTRGGSSNGCVRSTSSGAAMTA